ncbi:MAG: hypothetical protein FWD47_11035 [Treponema sp.]|nr:hypothetical protein [Treponema sp.]
MSVIFRQLALVLLILTFPLIQQNANPFWDKIQWSFSGTLQYFGADYGSNADPAPIIPSLGFSAAYEILPYLRIELTEDIYFSNYEFNTALGFPVPCSLDSRSAFVLGFVTGIQATGFFSLGNFLVRVYAGPAVDIRLVFNAFGLNHPGDNTGILETDPKLQTKAISEYFWSNARWFVPVIGAGMDFPVNQRFMAGFDIRFWIPADGWRMGVGLRITPQKNTAPQVTSE